MASQDAFNYSSALGRLIQLRFELRDRTDDEANPEILELERQIYAYVWRDTMFQSDAENNVATATNPSVTADAKAQ